MAALASRFLLGALLLTFSLGACAGSPAKIPGTYSSFTYNKEGGDLLGYEVRIIPTRQGLRAVVQVAEGGAGEVNVVEVNEREGGLTFDIPLIGDKPAKFEGRFTTNGLEGKITFSSGATEQVVLKRAVSYWER